MPFIEELKKKAQEWAKKQTEEAKRSPLYYFPEELPKATIKVGKAVGGFATDLAREIATKPFIRAGLEISRALAPKEEKRYYEQFQPTGKIQQVILGKEPIEAYSTTGERVKKWLEEKTEKKLPKITTPAIAFGLGVLDLPPIGGSKKVVAKGVKEIAEKVAKEGVEEVAEKGIKEVGEKIPQSNFQKLVDVLKEAKVLRGKQEEIYRAERAQKLAKMIEMSKGVEGEEGYIARLGALKGEMKKVNFESIAHKFSKEERDSFFNAVWKNEHLDEWEKLTAAEGLSKILGAEGGRVPTLNELEKLSAVFPQEVIETLLKKRPFGEKIKDLLIQAYNFPRTVMAGTLDLSATLLQNAIFAFRHPILTAKNFIEQVKMFGSEKYFRTMMDEVASRPNYKLYKKAGLELTDVGPIVRLREETFMSPFIEKIPGIGSVVRATGRAWTGFLNKMRADVADKMIENAKILGKNVEDEKFLKSLGYFINAATGRGKLGKLERIAPILGQGFFSARKLAATAQMINPAFYVKADPFVRKEALKTWLAFLGGGATILGLAKMAGAEVGTDPNSADFGKIKIGNTRFNIFGSYQQLAVLFSRLISGKMVSSTTGRIMELGEGYRPITRADIIANFFETKEHPTLSYLIDLLRGVDQIGRDFQWQPELLSRFIPMVFSDAYDLYKEHGPIGLLGVVPIVLGVPTQTYGAVELEKGISPLGEPILSVGAKPRIEDVLAQKIFGFQKPLSPSSGEIEVFYNQLKAMPPEEAARIFDQIAESNPDLAEKIVKVHEKITKGITPEDEVLKQKGVADGSRAKAIAEKLNKLKTNEEKAALWDEYVEKGIITKEVANQLYKILQQ